MTTRTSLDEKLDLFVRLQNKKGSLLTSQEFREALENEGLAASATAASSALHYMTKTLEVVKRLEGKEGLLALNKEHENAKAFLPLLNPVAEPAVEEVEKAPKPKAKREKPKEEAIEEVKDTPQPQSPEPVPAPIAKDPLVGTRIEIKDMLELTEDELAILRSALCAYDMKVQELIRKLV